MRVIRRDLQHVVGTHARGEKRLVCVAHRGIGEKHALLLPDPVREFMRAQLDQPVAGAAGYRRGEIPVGFVRVRERTIVGFSAFHLRVAVDRDLADELQQLGGAIAPRLEAEQLGSLIDKACCTRAGAE